MRQSAYGLLEGEGVRRLPGRLIALFLIVVVIVSVIDALVLTDSIGAGAMRPAVDAVLVFSTLVFSVEFLLRLWVAPEAKRLPLVSSARARLDYLVSVRGVIDLLAMAPLWIDLAWSLPADILGLLYVLRVLKLLRYTSALETLGSVIRNEARTLTATGVIMLTLLVIVSMLMYLAEHTAQPDKFGSALDALWWGIVTLGTVGYGDVVPTTGLGKLLGGLTVILGLGMFALPAGILASGFAEEIRKRNFVVTWNLVANVPLFATLPAARIAEIAAMLKPRACERTESVVRKGERADCMYFIVSGYADVVLPNGSIRLQAGDFFGEIALVIDTRRTADVVAATFLQLMLLPVADFRRLLAFYPDIRDKLDAVARERLAAQTES